MGQSGHGCDALMVRSAWPQPPLFAWLQREGNVEDLEMFRVFNCGIGMVIVVAPEVADAAAARLAADGETVYRIGHIVPAGAEPRARIE
jgi:phosphoribosylformylglycinamidine cyclo-ligase